MRSNTKILFYLHVRRLGAVALLIIFIIACNSREETADRGTSSTADRTDLKIVATTTQAADALTILTTGTESIEITPLMGAGVDPHLYQPTERDVAAMNSADMVVYSGLHLEGQFDAVFEALREQGVIVYALSKPVKEGGFIVGWIDQSLATAGTDDPHFWFDPRNWKISIEDLAAVVAESVPSEAATIKANSSTYLEQLDLLFEWALSGMTSVPEGQRFLVTSHDAFQYFGAAFGWQMAAIQGISTEDEAGVGDIQGTVDFVIEREIPVLFVESSIAPGTIEAVIEAIKAAGGTARIGVRELYSDAMGVPGTFGGTYVGMLAENVLTILQSYEAAGVAVSIAKWPPGLSVEPPSELFEHGS